MGVQRSRVDLGELEEEGEHDEKSWHTNVQELMIQMKS